MPTERKVQAVQDIQSWLEDATIVISTDYTGMPVSDAAVLRRSLRENDVRYKVVKNTLAYLAADAAGKPEIKEIIQGPSAVAFGYGEPTDPARLISTFIRESRSSLTITGAAMDGKTLTPEEVERLASLPGKNEMIARLLGQMNAPLSSLVYVLSAPLTGLARVLQAHIDASTAPAEPAADEPEPAEATA